MQELTKAQQGRIAIRAFKTIADALALRGFYRPNGQSGKTLERALRMLCPEIYGSMNELRRIELQGLEYVLDRLPRGVESCNRIVLTAQEEFADTPFEPIQPLKRRRLSYRVSEREICFVITRGLSEIYDILTHITFLNIEAKKNYDQMTDDRGQTNTELHALETYLRDGGDPPDSELDQALWDLSILLGRTYQETRKTYESLETNRREANSNNGLFRIVYDLGKRVEAENVNPDHALRIYFTPALQELIGHHKYGEAWARHIREKLQELNLLHRPLHIVSANMHSVVNTLYAYAALQDIRTGKGPDDLYTFFGAVRERSDEVREFALNHGLTELPDMSGAQIDCQIIDPLHLSRIPLHPDIHINLETIEKHKPLILVMDYAFGTQAFESMDELLGVLCAGADVRAMGIDSISIMGKAGILPGETGDILLATAHVIEGSTDNYIVDNELTPGDFEGPEEIYVGPMVTVLGTSLQNRDVLERFQTTTWQAVGLEMEGGHYQRAISAAIIRGHIPPDVKLRYAYYASDNPLISGQTLASGSMGDEGIRPTYMITKVILEKILYGERVA